MNKIEKMAQQDAHEWGVAQMFFGEGAGTRRKLVGAKIDQRVLDLPGYEDALNKAYEQLDQLEMAEKAIALRKSLDRSAKLGKNFRAVKSGQLNNMSTGVFVVVGTIIVLHKTGYDVVLEAKAKELYKKAKTEIKFRRLRAQGKNVERIFG